MSMASGASDTRRINAETMEAGSMERIEGLEQEIIQHIRTSGIRKPRETSLIDEVLEIRRERRKLFSVLNNQLTISNAEVKVLTENLKITNEKLTSVTEESTQKVAQKLQSVQLEQSTHERQLSEQFKMEMEKSKFEDKLKYDKMRNKYEKQIKLIEVQLMDLLEQKKSNDHTEARKIATEMIGAVKIEMENKYLGKIQEYKTLLVKISGREKDLEGSLQRHMDLINAFESENSKQKKTITMLENKIDDTTHRDKSLEIRNLELQKSLEEATQQIATLNAQLTGQHEAHQQKISQLNSEHEQNLSNVDEKVRKLLEIKEKEILSLKSELKYTVLKLKESEKLMDRINSEFVSVKKH